MLPSIILSLAILALTSTAVGKPIAVPAAEVADPPVLNARGEDCYPPYPPRVLNTREGDCQSPPVLNA